MKKWLELYDGACIRVETEASTVEDFLESVQTRIAWNFERQFRYDGEWYPAFDLDFVEI